MRHNNMSQESFHLISTRLGVSFIGLLFLALIVSLNQCNGMENESPQISTPPRNKFSDGCNKNNNNNNNSNNSSSWLASIDWSKDVIVVSSQSSATLKMDESTDLRLVISAACSSHDVKHRFLLESSSTGVAYLPANQKTSFTLSCEWARPAVETVDTMAKFCPQLSSDNVVAPKEETAEATVNKPQPPDTSADDAKIPGGYDGTENKTNSAGFGKLPRVTLVVNLTILGDLVGRSWLLVTSTKKTSPSQLDHGKEQFRDTTWSELASEEATSGGERSSTFGDVVYEVPIIVLRNIRPIDEIFRYVLFAIVALSSVAMGCKTDLGLVKQVLKRPVAPAMGFLGQSIGMPLVAFAMAKSFSFENPAVSLGIFTCGVCPGGGTSNIFTYLLKGDLSLSVTMTCVSSVLAMAMIPLWMFTLGQQFNDDKISIHVPYLKILQSLVAFVVPVFIGFFINVKFPKLCAQINRTVKPLSIITLVLVTTLGMYSNMYMFRLVTVNIVVAAGLLPYIGYILGGSLAFISRQPWPRVKTIAIETGIQNAAIGYLMITFSLPEPDNDIAAVGSMASAMMTPLPLLVLCVIYMIYLKVEKDKKSDKVEEDEEEQSEEGWDKDKDTNLKDKGNYNVNEDNKYFTSSKS